MSQRSIDRPGPPLANRQTRTERCQVRLVPVPAGVAEGRTRRRGLTIRTERWTLFQTREQFDACAAEDPLRFADPLQFRQITAEAEDVFTRRG